MHDRYQIEIVIFKIDCNFKDIVEKGDIELHTFIAISCIVPRLDRFEPIKEDKYDFTLYKYADPISTFIQ